MNKALSAISRYETDRYSNCSLDAERCSLVFEAVGLFDRRSTSARGLVANASSTNETSGSSITTRSARLQPRAEMENLARGASE